MSKQIVLETKGLSKVYGSGDNEFHALKDINVAISKGESVAIIGKSGSGKSTLMHLMALMDAPSMGEIAINGSNSGELPGKELDALRNQTFGFVFQQFFLNGSASVLDNVILPLKIAGVSSSERKKRGMEALKSVELEDKAKNKASDLSGGQKQRVVIARALINKPSIIFADEPTGNLDSNTGKRVEDILFNMNKKEGITLIIVTHDEELAKRCKRQIRIKDGAVVEGKK